MSDHQPDDLVERATAELRATPFPDGPPPDAVARTLAALRKAADAPQPRFLTRRFVMRSLTAAAAVAVATVAVVHFTATPAVAFAAVAQKVADAKTMSYRTSTEVPGKKDPVVTRTYYLAPDRTRMEAPEGVVSVMDLPSGKAMILNPVAKIAMFLDLKMKDKPEKPKDDQAGMIDFFRTMAGKDGKPAGKKKIGNVEAQGFLVEEAGREWTVWADPKTKLPVLVETTVPIGGGQSAKLSMDEFKFDEPLDEKLFRLDPPEGYKVDRLEVQVPSPGDAPEKYVIEVLRRYAAKAGGKFPDDLEDWGAFAVLVSKDSKDGQLSKDDVQLMTTLGGLAGSLAALPKGDYAYTGKGVKLGAADKVVFWYKAKDKYRAVYGDLKVSDTDKDKLPPAPKKAK